MNSYLDLVKEYAKKHKNKNRMSLFGKGGVFYITREKGVELYTV